MSNEDLIAEIDACQPPEDSPTTTHELDLLARCKVALETAEREKQELYDDLHKTALQFDTAIDRAEAAEAALAELQEERGRLREALVIVQEQAEDERLWFQPVHITEDTLQKELRRLHAAIEGKTSEECAIAALAPEQPDSGEGGTETCSVCNPQFNLQDAIGICRRPDCPFAQQDTGYLFREPLR